MSKNKGNRYEIKIARMFSRWYQPNDDIEYFWRTAGSGAKATITKRAETPFIGDITFLPSPNLLLPVLEVKNNKKVTFDNVNTEAFLPTVYYKETVEKARKIGVDKPAWIIFKLHRFETDYIYLDREQWFKYYCSDDIPYPPHDFDSFCINTEKFMVCTLREFLEKMPKGIILGGEN